MSVARCPFHSVPSRRQQQLLLQSQSLVAFGGWGWGWGRQNLLCLFRHESLVFFVIVPCFKNMVIMESGSAAVLGVCLKPSGPQDVPKLLLYPVGFCACLANSPEPPLPACSLPSIVSLACSSSLSAGLDRPA